MRNRHGEHLDFSGSRNLTRFKYDDMLLIARVRACVLHVCMRLSLGILTKRGKDKSDSIKFNRSQRFQAI